MPTHRRVLSFSILMTWNFLILSCPLGHQARSADEPKTAKPRALSDGKTLDGWKQAGFGGSGEVKAADGAIVIGAGEPMTGVTTTHKDLPTNDYELSYEASRLEGHDFFAAATFPVGKAFITLVNGGWGNTVTGLSSIGGSDASENETTIFVPYENKKWYRFRVQVSGTVIRCWVDGKQVIDVDHEGRHVATRIETRMNQPLGFASYESTGAIRKVTVRSLTAEEIKALKQPSGGR